MTYETVQDKTTAATNEKVADYIIAGAGCAGLSLAVHMIRSGAFKDKKVLLLDRDPKQANDRTWCFWHQGAEWYDPIVYKQWSQLWFYGEGYSRELCIDPYSYKMIRGIDFYNYCLQLVGGQDNFEIRQGRVEGVFSDEEGTGVLVDGEKLYAEYVFNSILFQKPSLRPNEYWLLQHFKGWIIETNTPTFDPHSAVLMDFRISQHHGAAFCYVLPFSSNRALVEYTLFTPQVLPQQEYDKGLRDYLHTFLKIDDYKVVEEEFGVIPMTNVKFPASDNRIIHIGTAGGQTKGSSGYTFTFIQKHSAAIVRGLIRSGKPIVKKTSPRFAFYDSVLLHILHHQTLGGKEIFTDLFQKNDPRHVLKFLDNESTLAEELKIISSLPTLPFLKAALKQILPPKGGT